MADLIGRSLLAVTGTRTARKLFTESHLGRSLAERFVAGDSLESAIEASLRLNAEGMSVSLDHLGEHVTHRSLALAARDGYVHAIGEMATAGVDGNISVKLSQLGLGMDDALAIESLDALAAAASAAGTTVTVDMEESALTDATIKAYAAVQAERGNLGIAVQSYLHRTPADLDVLIPLGGHIRLCKGAYAEPEAVAHQDKEAVDLAYDRLLERLMQAESTYPAVATHDGRRIALARQLAPLRTGDFEFQMLYGVRRPLQAELARRYRMRIYVPYGENWYPYLTRRLAERPANLLFFLRALVGRR